MRTIRHGDRRQRGFTLVEALVTVGILAITLALGGPALWEITHEVKLKQAARETLATMRAARYRAINEVRDYTVLARFPNRLQMFEGNDPTDATALRQEIVLPGGIAFGGPNAANPAIDTFTINADGGFVTFAADGSADTDGAIRFSNPNTHFVEIRLDPATTARLRLRTWKSDGAGSGTWEDNG